LSRGSSKRYATQGTRQGCIKLLIALTWSTLTCRMNAAFRRGNGAPRSRGSPFGANSGFHPELDAALETRPVSGCRLAFARLCSLSRLLEAMNVSLETNLSGPIRNESELEDVLTRPSAGLVEFIKTLSGPLLVLGAGGKMGPTLAGLARRAAEMGGNKLAVVAVSRFGDGQSREWLEGRGVETLSCDLLDAEAVAALPDADNIVCLVGMKFGTARSPAATWATNTLVPARVCQRYARSRIVAISTGNVYPLGAVSRGGSVEGDALTPLGEYANASVGRERIFEFYSQRYGTAIALMRLCYAVELRYGVLTDIAQKVYAGEAVPLSTGYFNCIWQGDASDMILRSLALAGSPPSAWNLCRPEAFSTRGVAMRLGELLGRAVRFVGEEAETALLVNAGRLCARLGPPPTPLEAMLAWTAHWVQAGGRDLGKPTHFEVRDGNY
jgi:NAD dependent epimerase/dehydratase family